MDSVCVRHSVQRLCLLYRRHEMCARGSFSQQRADSCVDGVQIGTLRVTL